MKLKTFHIGTFKSTELKAAPAHLFELLFLFLSYHGKARGLHVSLPCSGPCPSCWRKTHHFSLQFWEKTGIRAGAWHQVCHQGHRLQVQWFTRGTSVCICVCACVCVLKKGTKFIQKYSTESVKTRFNSVQTDSPGGWWVVPSQTAACCC